MIKTIKTRFLSDLGLGVRKRTQLCVRMVETMRTHTQ